VFLKTSRKYWKAIEPTDYVVLLDDKGKNYSSPEFAGYIEKKMHSVPKRLVFLIGGPYGFSKNIYDVANEKISLSKMTFTHQMVRMIFTEQLYRALTILNNEPYHHE
jgi:23S rRNA (pseudouridine1915-N3)-methyltransferase